MLRVFEAILREPTTNPKPRHNKDNLFRISANSNPQILRHPVKYDHTSSFCRFLVTTTPPSHISFFVILRMIFKGSEDVLGEVSGKDFRTCVGDFCFR